MDVNQRVGKGLWRLVRILLKVLRVAITVVCDVSLSSNKGKTSVYGPQEARELYEKGDISLNEFLIATRPRQ